MTTARATFDRGIILLVAAVQFVNVLDFVMVMPLGPDFARALGIDESHLGWVGGSYTLAAGVTGLIASRFLDRYDRRSALAVCMLGLVTGTAAGGLATDLSTMLLARGLAGAFGGPATSLAISIVSDTVAAHERGRAMGLVMGAFSLASVIGVPTGLWAAELLTWRAPFFGVAGMGLVIAGLALAKLPPLRGHLVALPTEGPAPSALLSRPEVQASYVMTAVVMMAGFTLIPNISAHFQLNLGVPRDALKWLYFFGGLSSFATLQVAGRMVDRFGAVRVGTAGSFVVVALVGTVFLAQASWCPPTLFFILFMMAMGTRNVAYQALTSRVPGPGERARFQSLQSAIQHGASAAGAFLAAQMLTPSSGEPRRLLGMGAVAVVSMALSATIPWLMHNVQSRLSPVVVPSSNPG